MLVDSQHGGLSNLAGSAARSASNGLIASHKVCQSTPSRGATAATEAVSRWMIPIAHHAARVVSLARATASLSSSVNQPPAQAGSAHRASERSMGVSWRSWSGWWLGVRRV
jgi:hypothetical protein